MAAWSSSFDSGVNSSVADYTHVWGYGDWDPGGSDGDGDGDGDGEGEGRIPWLGLEFRWGLESGSG